MDQSKLFKAFERNKVQRTGEPVSSAATQTKPVKNKVSESQQVITDLVPNETLFARNASLSDMRNPNPLAISDMKKKKLVYSGMKNRAVLNAYRELRIKLMDQSESSNMMVMISSVDTNDNSIVTAMNLAISFSLGR